MAKPRIRVRTDGEIVGGELAALDFQSQRRDAARTDISELSGWIPGLNYSGSDPFGERERVLGRGRDLDRNNGWINGGIDRRVESVIGVNIRLNAQPVYSLLGKDFAWRTKWAADVQDRFRVWDRDIHHRCDARMRLSFGAIARLAYLSYVRDGEAAAEIRDDKRGVMNTTNVLLVEPERISNPQDRALIEGPMLRDGVALDANGAPYGYWVRSGHPNDPNPTFQSQRWDFVPRFGPTGRAKFIHVMNPRQVEQNRGISRLAEVMVPAKMLDRVDRAEVNAALKSAIFSMFIKSPGRTEDVAAALAPADSAANAVDPWINEYVELRKANPIRVEGAQINHLLPDEDVEFPDATRPNSNYPDFARFVLQKVAGSLGVSYPQMSQDWAGINYSSARALLNELWRSFLEDRQYFCHHFLTPIYAAWLEIEVLTGSVKIPGRIADFYRNKTALCNAEWIGPGRGSVDPLKEANANNLDEAAGRRSAVQSILETGRDPSDVLAEEVWYKQERERLGLQAVNNNVKATVGADGGDDGSGGSEADRDGDGIPNEAQRKKGKGAGDGEEA